MSLEDIVILLENIVTFVSLLSPSQTVPSPPSNGNRIDGIGYNSVEHHHQRHPSSGIMEINDEGTPLLLSPRPGPPVLENRRHHQQRLHSSNRRVAPLTSSSLSHRPPLPNYHSQRRQLVSQGLQQQQHENNPNHQDLSSICCSHGICCIQCVRTQEIGILQRFGKFEQLLKPGLHCLPWPCATIQNRVSLKIQQLDVKCETKTRDNVFVHLTTSILYQVQPSKAYEANYSLVNPRSQISAHVLNIVRSVVPTLKLDHVFLSSKSDISLEVSRSLQGFMNKYGYDILNVLVQDIQPEEKVKKSMNEIMSAKKWKQAMVHKAEGEKIKKVKDAEAHAEVLYLHGVGISKERTEISHGLRDAMINFTSSNDDTSIKNTAATSKDVMDILVLSHYFDTLASIGSNRVLLHMDPGELKELRGQLSPFFAKASNDGEADGGNSVVDIPDFLW